MNIVDQELIREVTARASSSPRLRANHNLHPRLEDPIQRLLNAMEPGTYVRPHRHTAPDRWELFLVVAGAAAVLTFDDVGVVRKRVEMRRDGPVLLVEIPGGAWHTVVVLEPGTVLFELKPGPYQPISDEDFAPWAPVEGRSPCARWEAWFQGALPQDSPPAL